jgi:diketogulonate reductase-like aldo/keto reductase
MSRIVPVALLRRVAVQSVVGEGTQLEGGKRDSWAALESLVEASKVRFIGVSNFTLTELRPRALGSLDDPYCFQSGAL